MSVLQLAEQVDIVHARPEDAEAIFKLATSLFGNKQFLYTIYQAPESVRHLERLIATGNRANPCVVLKADGRLVGYYEAVAREGCCFLNYIGVETAASGCGYGTLLMAHFTGLARDLRCQELALDVFESNERALRWYERAGFAMRDKRYLTRYSLCGTTSRVCSGAILDEKEFQERLCEEATMGFSKISCRLGIHSFLLGLIGGHTCKVLTCEEADLAAVIDGAAALMCGTRRTLVASSTAPIACNLPLASRETVLRMTKLLA